MKPATGLSALASIAASPSGRCIPERTALAALVSFALLVATAASQVDLRVIEQHGAVGTDPANERWIATFKGSGLDLSEFRKACYGRAAPDAVARIVAGLEQRAIANQAEFARQVTRLGGRVTRHWWLINACAFEVPRTALRDLATLSEVAALTPDREMRPATPIKTSTNATNHRTDSAQLSFQGSGVGIAIMDTGLDASMNGTGQPHKLFFQNGVKPGVNLLAANFQVGAVTAEDQHGHGTAVAGVAAGAKWNNGSTADFGHAYNATKIGFGICDALPACTAFYSTSVTAWQMIAANKVAYDIRVANNSYAGDPDPTGPSQQALDSAAYNADVLITVAAGNDGANGTQNSQSCANGLAVAACEANTKKVATFSSIGPMFNDTLRTYPDITACGLGMVMPLHNNEASVFVDSGTSYAAPAVAGTAVLVRQADPSATALETKAVLLANTESIATQNPSGNVNWYGAGFLRSDLSVNTALNSQRTFTDLITDGSVRTYSMGVTAGQKYQVVLAWHRSDFATTSWSDLNLEVVNGATVVASSATPRNLWERVAFTAPLTGNVTIRVSHTGSLAGGSETFAVCHTGTPAPGTTATFTYFGTGCVGSSGAVPLHTAIGTPRLGTTLTLEVSQALPNAAATLFVGWSNTSWNGVTLPLSLTGQGAFGCSILVSADFTFPATADASGKASILMPVPNYLSLAGVHFYTQFNVSDPTLNPMGRAFTRGGDALMGNL